MKKENINKIYIPQSEGIPDINSYEGLNKHYLKVSESLSEIHKKEEEEAQNQHKQILELAGRKRITGEEPNTLVCDGATLICPLAEFNTRLLQMGDDAIAVKEKSAMVEFKVHRKSGYLMGKDPIGTINDNLPENFNLLMEVKCSLTGNVCKINEYGGEWSNYSKNFFVNGYNALIKASLLKCNIEEVTKKCFIKDKEPLLEIVYNGQNPEIKNAILGSLFSPSDRNFIKSVVIVATVVIITKNIGAVVTEGRLLFLYNQGYAATGSTLGGVLYTELQTGVGAKTFALAESTKSLFENSDEGMMLIKKAKSIAGEPGIQMYGFAKETVGNIETAGFISKGIFEADMFLKNKKLDKEISQNNIKLKNLERIENKTFKDAIVQIEKYKTNKNNDELSNKKFKNFTFISDRVEDIEKKINNDPKNSVKKIVIKEIKTSIPSDWLNYRSQIEYSKQPFLTDIEIKGVK